MKRLAFIAALVVVCTLLAIAGIRQLARSRTIQLFGRLVSRVDATEPVVALTFDDGPTPATIDEILNALAARNVHATFFVTGGDLAATPEAGRRLVAAGHELGNHTYSHPRMVFKAPAFIREEIERTDALIRAAGYQGEIFFRPPFCWKFVALPWFLRSTGRTSVTWDVEPESYSEVPGSPASIAAYVVDHVRPGSIIILHVWFRSGAASLAAVPLVVDQLRAKGYGFVTVDELLRLGTRRLQ